MSFDDTIAALADPKRRELIRRLARKPCRAGELAQRFAMSRPAICKHARLLKRAGLMFKKLLVLWSGGAMEVPHFAFYLERHIELDRESHGPWARQMLTALAGADEDKWTEAALAAQEALSSRIRLWDRAVAHLKNIG